MTNENEEEYYIPEQEQEQRSNAGKLLPPETPAEFLKYIIDPAVRQQYTHITKDLAISNISARNSQEMDFLFTNLRLLHLIDFIEVGKGEYKQIDKDKFIMVKAPDLDPSRHVILKDIYSYLQLLRSKDGFERKMETTSVSKQQITTEQIKRGGILGR